MNNLRRGGGNRLAIVHPFNCWHWKSGCGTWQLHFTALDDGLVKGGPSGELWGYQDSDDGLTDVPFGKKTTRVVDSGCLGCEIEGDYLLSGSVEDGAHVASGVVLLHIFKLQNAIKGIQGCVVASSRPNDLRSGIATGPARDEQVVTHLHGITLLGLNQKPIRHKFRTLLFQFHVLNCLKPDKSA